jgi:outer membrane protein TolC
LALRERPDWIASLLANEAADIGLAVARNGQLWDLRLAASHARTSLHSATSSYNYAFGGLVRPDSEENFLGLTLTVPIWDNFSRRQQIVSAKNSRRERELTHENLRRNIEADVTDQLRNLEVAWKSLELARTSPGFAETALQDESLRLSSGLSTTLNVTRLEDILVSAQNAELGAVIGYLNAVSAFDTTLGTTLTTWHVRLDAERGDLPLVTP